MEAGDHNVQVPEEQGVIHTRLEQEGAHVGLEEGAAGGDPSLQLLQGEGAAPDPWCVGLQQHISLRTCSGVLHLVIFCAENQRNSTKLCNIEGAFLSEFKLAMLKKASTVFAIFLENL